MERSNGGVEEMAAGLTRWIWDSVRSRWPAALVPEPVIAKDCLLWSIRLTGGLVVALFLGEGVANDCDRREVQDALTRRQWLEDLDKHSWVGLHVFRAAGTERLEVIRGALGEGDWPSGKG